MLQTSFFAHEILSLKLSKAQNFRKMRQFLNRAVINELTLAKILILVLFDIGQLPSFMPCYVGTAL